MQVLPGGGRTLRPVAPGAPALEEAMSCDTGIPHVSITVLDTACKVPPSCIYYRRHGTFYPSQILSWEIVTRGGETVTPVNRIIMFSRLDNTALSCMHALACTVL